MFHPFRKLPAELRIEIWRLFLDQETLHRFVILDGRRVIPGKQLVSPLLIVNRESRSCALKHYPLKLRVRRPKLKALAPYDDSDEEEEEHDGYRGYASSNRTGLQSVREKRQPQVVGCLHLSPQRDILVINDHEEGMRNQIRLAAKLQLSPTPDVYYASVRRRDLCRFQRMMKSLCFHWEWHKPSIYRICKACADEYWDLAPATPDSTRFHMRVQYLRGQDTGSTTKGQEALIHDVLTLDGAAVWEKYNILELRLARCIINDASFVDLLVDSTKLRGSKYETLSSSGAPGGGGGGGADEGKKILVLEDEKAEKSARTGKVSCTGGCLYAAREGGGVESVPRVYILDAPDPEGRMHAIAYGDSDMDRERGIRT